MPEKNQQNKNKNADDPRSFWIAPGPPKATEEPAKTDTVLVWKEVTATEYMSMRAAPSPTAEVLLYLTRGHKYMVEISGKPWLKVKHPKLGERIGYVSATILNSQPGK